MLLKTCYRGWTLLLVASSALASADSRISSERQPLATRHPAHYLERRFRGLPRFRLRQRPQYNAEGLASGIHPALGVLVRWDNRRHRAKSLRAEERAAERTHLRPSQSRHHPHGTERRTGGSPVDPGSASTPWFTPLQSPIQQPSGLVLTSKKQKVKKWWKPGTSMRKCFSCSAVTE